MRRGRPSQRMSDLVQDHIANFRLPVRRHKVGRQLDPPLGIPAKPQRPLAAIELETPSDQPVFAQ